MVTSVAITNSNISIYITGITKITERIIHIQSRVMAIIFERSDIALYLI